MIMKFTMPDIRDVKKLHSIYTFYLKLVDLLLNSTIKHTHNHPTGFGNK